MSAAAIQLKINELEADIIDIKGNIKLSKELKLQYIDRNKELIIILMKEIEKLSPTVNQTQTGEIMVCYIVEMFYSIFLCTCTDVTDEILENLMNLNKNTQAIQKDIKVVKHRTVQISHITIETNRPQPSSTKTDRLHHQIK